MKITDIPEPDTEQSAILFTHSNPIKKDSDVRPEFGLPFKEFTKVKVLRVINRRGGEEVILIGIIKSLTTVGAFVYDPEKDKTGIAAEWFPYVSPMQRLVLA
jgi:hypothetical protein